MSVENVKKFYEAVSQDEAMKQKFVELSQRYQGQTMDEAKGMSIFEQEALPLAKQMGYSFTMDDLKAYEMEMKQPKMKCELSDEEMQAVAGGSMVCVVVSWNPKSNNECCAMIGIGRGNDGSWQTCVLVGVM